MYFLFFVKIALSLWAPIRSRAASFLMERRGEGGGNRGTLRLGDDFASALSENIHMTKKKKMKKYACENDEPVFFSKNVDIVAKVSRDTYLFLIGFGDATNDFEETVFGPASASEFDFIN